MNTCSYEPIKVFGLDNPRKSLNTMASPAIPRDRKATPARRPPKRDSDELCEIDCVHADTARLARANLPAHNSVASLAEIFKTLGDPTRLRIVAALAGRELCVCDLSVVLDASQSAVSHSLRALRQLRLVTYRKVGRIAYYKLDDYHISALVGEGFRHVDEVAHEGRR
jgi:DNA-binding transcriptional ArsR family regulator